MIEIRTNLPDFSRQMQRAGAGFRAIAAAATRAAAREIANEVKRRAPVRTGRLQRAVVIKRARIVPRGSVHYIVGIRQGAAQQRIQRRGKSVNLDAFYWRFLEGGWIPRRPKDAMHGGRRTKSLQARRARLAGGRIVRYAFIEPAFQSSAGRALTAFYATLDQGFKKLQT